MRINHISLTNFRNYSRLETDLHPGAIVLWGDNAQGKTNFLEAIYYLATSRSPYTRSDNQLINWLAEDEPLPHARLEVELVSGNEIKRLDITLVKEERTGGEARLNKEIRINGLTRRTLDLLGHLVVVMFMPQDMALVEGPPRVRRRYLDVTLCQVQPDYCRALSQMEKVLSQRNALLKRLAEAGKFNGSDELLFWDERLAKNAGVVMAARNRLVRALEELAQPIQRELTGGQETLRLSYQPSFDPTADHIQQMAFAAADLGASALPELEPAVISDRYLTALKMRRKDEIARRQTLIGPQRDEMRFLINGRDAGHFGSRGQGRTAVLALKLAEAAWMREQTGEWPVLLLDEVVAELDDSRRGYLMDKINGAEQILLTTTDPNVFSTEFREKAVLWQVQDGRITKGA